MMIQYTPRQHVASVTINARVPYFFSPYKKDTVHKNNNNSNNYNNREDEKLE